MLMISIAFDCFLSFYSERSLRNHKAWFHHYSLAKHRRFLRVHRFAQALARLLLQEPLHFGFQGRLRRRRDHSSHGTPTYRPSMIVNDTFPAFS